MQKLKIDQKNYKTFFSKRSFFLLFCSILIATPIFNFDSLNAKSSRIKNAELLSKKIFDDIFYIINNNESNENKKKSLLNLFDRHADVPIIARAVLGSPWRQLSQIERTNFTNAFRQYLAKKYTAQFSEFAGAEMLIERSRDSGGKAGIMVETRLLMPGSCLLYTSPSPRD